MEGRRTAFQNFFDYLGGDELLRASPAVAEFLGVAPIEPLQLNTGDAPQAITATNPTPAQPARSPSPVKPPSPPPIPEKITWKSHPFEDALSALDMSDKQTPSAAPKPAPKPASASRPPAAAAAAPATASAFSLPGLAAPSSGFQPFSFGLATSAGAGPAGGPSESNSYPKTCAGLREAVKSRDDAAVRELLALGLDPCFVDMQGMTLLHVAAMFNATEIACMLVDAGASPDVRNGQDETVYDVAPVMLASKLRERVAARVAAVAAH